MVPIWYSVKEHEMSYFHKFVDFSTAIAYHTIKNDLPLFQQIADMLTKIGLVGTRQAFDKH